MDKKRDKKNKYKQRVQDSKRSEELKRGMTGFLVTCDASKEKRCLNEVFNVLNEFVDICYPDLDYTQLLAQKAPTSDEPEPASRKDDLDQAVE